MFKIQTEPLICGPLSIYNAMIDLKIGSPKIEILIKFCKTQEKNVNYYRGTCPEFLETTLKQVLENRFKVYRVNLRSIENLKNFIVLYAKHNGSAHYVYVKKVDEGYLVVNHDDVDISPDGYFIYSDLKKLVRFLSEFRTDRWNLYRYPMIWSIT